MNENNTQPWQQPQNPDVANLTKSIALQEGGGKVDYNAVGDNGTSHMAYQWQPGNYASEATQFGLDPDDDSPENQDKVAYSEVSSLSSEFKDKGYPAAEIPAMVAAAWNAGTGSALSGSWKTNIGKKNINGTEVPYNTPDYVQGVAKYYNQFSGQQDPTPPQNQVLGDTQSVPPATPIDDSGSSQGNPVSNFISSIPNPWKIAIGTGVAGLGLLGLNFIPGIGEVADVAAGADALGGAEAAEGAEAATGAADTASQGGGLLSKLKGMAGNVGVDLGVNAATKGIFGSGGNTQQGPYQSDTPGQDQNWWTPDQQTDPQSSGQPQSTQQTVPPVQASAPLTPQDFSQSNSASQQVYNATYDALGETPTGSVYRNTAEAQNGNKFNSLYGIAADGTQGAYDVEGAMQKSYDIIGDLADAKTDITQQDGTRVNVQDAIKDAQAEMRSSGYTPKSEWEEGDKVIEDEYRKYFSDITDGSGQTSGVDAEKFSKEQGKLGRFDIESPMSSAKRNAHRTMNRSMSKTVNKNIQDPHLRDLHAQMTEHQKGLYDGQKVLKKLNNKKAHPKHALGGRIARQLAQAAEIAIGAKIGGPVGAVVGAFVGHQLNKVADKKFGKSVLDQPAIKKALEMADKRSPHIRQIVEEVLKQKTAEAMARPRLNKPSYIPMGGKTPPQSGVKKPEKSGGLYEHIQNIEASKKAALGGKKKKHFKGQYLPLSQALNKNTAKEVTSK